MRVRFMGAKLLSAKIYDIHFLRVGFRSSGLKKFCEKQETGGLKYLDKIYKLRNFT